MSCESQKNTFNSSGKTRKVGDIILKKNSDRSLLIITKNKGEKMFLTQRRPMRNAFSPSTHA